MKGCPRGGGDHEIHQRGHERPDGCMQRRGEAQNKTGMRDHYGNNAIDGHIEGIEDTLGMKSQKGG